MRAIDVSGYQPQALTALIQEHKAEHVVVKLYLPEETVSQEHSRAQIESARANSCTVGGYLFGYRDLSPRKSVRDAIALARSCRLALPVLWIDMETYDGAGPDAAWLRAAVAECRALGVRPGVYSALWYWRDYMGGTDEFRDLPLWTAEYDGRPDLDIWTRYGGWDRIAAKQWSADPIDQDVFAAELT